MYLHSNFVINHFDWGVQIELQCKDGSKIAVSCWLTKAESENEGSSLYIAVIEPVQRVVAHLLLDESGTILEADEMSFSLFQSTEDAFIGHKIQNWVPNILWPSSADDLDAVSYSFFNLKFSNCNFF